ncbi:hypothetical protein [Chryseobacterium polytrichastri]|uniref:C1q domain-containing protein n=1 Tax=Chryseobacterium polytrichastri TaxID=1302687 RepID=A0A1M6QNQ6_9FLAO|nr:hypothetical protein [Chryseobacterium polytrichastri]SHK21929.1 hypothetical protein SAMN05444267_100238 [Chryseobacterium polytrichastri]
MRKIFILAYIAGLSTWANAQIGINTSTPQASLDVTGKPTTTSSLDGIIPPRMTGAQLRAKTYTAAQTGAHVYVTAADTAPAGQTVNVQSAGNYYFDGTVWKYLAGTANTLPNGTGTVIMINGVLQVAQEMSLRMQQDWTVPIVASSGTPTAIGNITNKLIDNYNGFTGTTTTNSFKVTNDGTYLVGMNFPLQNQNGNVLSGNFYYGVYNVTDARWAAFTIYTVDAMNNGDVKDISYNAAVDLLASKTYAFYVYQNQNNYNGSNGALLKIRGLAASGGSNLEIGYYSVKRLK